MSIDMNKGAPTPTGIELHKQSKTLELKYENGENFKLPAEYLRVYSPSAEVRGHSPDQAVLQTGKIHVGITDIAPMGHYAILIKFSDGHDTGIYSWDYLYDLGKNQEQHWQAYLDDLAEAGESRDPDIQVVKIGEWKPEE